MTWSDPQLFRRHRVALDARADFGEGRVARSREVVAERRETAVVGRAQLRQVDELRGLEDPVADLGRRFHARGDPRVLDAPNSVHHGGLVERLQSVFPDAPGAERSDAFDQLLRTWNTSDRLGA